MDADDVIDRLARVDRPDRLDEFRERYAADLCHADYWAVIAQMWKDRAPAAPEDRWERIWQQAKLAPGARDALMSAEERSAYAALPELLDVFRDANADELSWTRDRQRAERSGAVVSARVAKADVVALFRVRGEEELVVVPVD